MRGLRETAAAATSVGPTRRPLAVSSVRLTRRPRDTAVRWDSAAALQHARSLDTLSPEVGLWRRG
jgi:hypothetical protein